MFKFELGHTAYIFVSGEGGEVIGRAEYKSGNIQYLIRYKCADGRAVEQWWDEDAVERVHSHTEQSISNANKFRLGQRGVDE